MQKQVLIFHKVFCVLYFILASKIVGNDNDDGNDDNVVSKVYQSINHLFESDSSP